MLVETLLAGGFGAILAGMLVHHKTRKWYFWLSWIIGLFVDVSLIYLMLKYLK
ncbi:uncharacterized membrane protein YsdA (DUF1294 family) [Lactovum miscens]|uniref:Uncharacterized membrane protein YsdA (DUF1294 family) n=1 Tax=Lactovum miscens TaxID=190387 RepID=A0A841C5P1_9LACT|nr:uncharacterized membrane protein YsdA (DUF1294 family) [Lactovum miscens]